MGPYGAKEALLTYEAARPLIVLLAGVLAGCSSSSSTKPSDASAPTDASSLDAPIDADAGDATSEPPDAAYLAVCHEDISTLCSGAMAPPECAVEWPAAGQAATWCDADASSGPLGYYVASSSCASISLLIEPFVDSLTTYYEYDTSSGKLIAVFAGFQGEPQCVAGPVGAMAVGLGCDDAGSTDASASQCCPTQTATSLCSPMDAGGAD